MMRRGSVPMFTPNAKNDAHVRKMSPRMVTPSSARSSAGKPDHGSLIVTLAEAFNVKLVPSSTTIFTLRSRDDVKAWEDFRDRKRGVGEMPKVNVECRPRDPEFGPDRGCSTCVFSKDEDVYVYYMVLAVVHEAGGVFANLLAHAHVTVRYACDTFSQVNEGYIYVHEHECAPEKRKFVYWKEDHKKANKTTDHDGALTIPDRTESARKQLCTCCGRLLRKNYWCGGCKKVPYCSEECQHKQWPQHRRECDGRKKKK